MAPTPDQLALLDETREVRIRTRSGDRAVDTIIWVVVTDGTVYVRSVTGERGRWYRRALANPNVAILVDGDQIEFEALLVTGPEEIDAVSDALRAKYRPGGSLDRMTSDHVLETTLRLDPV